MEISNVIDDDLLHWKIYKNLFFTKERPKKVPRRFFCLIGGFLNDS